MKPLTVGSTFTGVGGADLGFEWAGFDIKWQCEFDSWKQQILRAHWPDIELYEDIRTMQDPPPVDVMIGGFPCQDLSVAGRRKGFDGERSVLAFEFLRVAESVKPRWIVLENVPGLLSSNRGRDFARLIDEVVGCGYGVAWRILDARYFGVPQRRRRVFIVARRADAQHDPRAASRLALRALFESSSGDTSPSWQAWAKTARNAGSSVDGGGIVGSHGDAGVGPTGTLTRMYSEQSGQDFGGGQESSRVVCEPDPAGALTKRYAKGVNTTMDDGAIIANSASYWVEDCENAALRANGAHDGPPRTDKQPLVTQTIMGDVTHALTRAASKATTEDGTGRGVPIVQQTFSVYPEGGNGADIAASSVERSPSLTKVKSERGIHVVPFNTEFSNQASRGGDVMHALDRNANAGVANRMTVRRLTPVECERLMGWPDNYTAPEGVKAPDSKRYAACGDGIVAPVAFWIADRIRMIEEEEEK